MMQRHLLLAASISSLLFCTSSCSAPEASTDAPAGGQQPTASAGDPGAQDPGTATPTATQDPAGSINAERTRFLVRNYLQSAEQLRGRGEFDAAMLQLQKAKELQPTNQEVAAMMRALAAETQDPGVAVPRDLAEVEEINAQRRRAEVVGLLDSAGTALSEQDYRSALDDLRRARLSIEIARGVDWGDLADRVGTMTADAEDMRDQLQAAEEEAKQQEIANQRRAAEEAREARRQARVENLILRSMQAFRARQFKHSQDLAYEAMQVDSNNQVARDLHNTATKALRDTTSDRYYQEMRKEIQGMMEAREELRIPQTDILYQNPETWQRALQRQPLLRADAPLDPADADLRRRLSEETVSALRFTEDDGSFDEVKTRIQAITGIPIIINPAAQDTIDSEGLTVSMDITAPISIENFLGLMVGRSEELTWTVRSGVVEITTKALAGGDNRPELVDVRDLVAPRTEFIAPSISDIPNDQESDIPRTGGESAEKSYYIEMDSLIAQLQDATGRDYWDSDGGGTIQPGESGYLIVNANSEKRAAVNSMLNDFRRFSTTVVTIKSKFLAITDNFLQEIGVDWRGLGGAGAKGTVAALDDITNGLDDNSSQGLDNSGTADPAGNPIAGAFFNDGGDGDVRGRTENFFSDPLGSALSNTGGATAALTFLDDLELQAVIRAVEKSENVQELNSQEITVLNNQRGHVAIVNQTAYVRDFSVEVAQASFIADPIVDVIQDGVVLDVKPTVAHSRREITLELSPTVAELVRPIPTFSTSLAGSTQPVTVQLPVLEVRSLATVATVPDGGSVLIGGLREINARERRAEVPIFSQIPLLGFFFKQEGVSEETSSLVILVTAAITDVKDFSEGRR